MPIRIRQTGSLVVYSNGALAGWPVSTGGPSGAVQFNTTGFFDGEAEFVYDKNNDRLHLTGSFSQGLAGNDASGAGSRAAGQNSEAAGIGSHAEGQNSIASGLYSHAEGASYANGTGSHSEGSATTAAGSYSHSEGGDSIANGDYSHAEGEGTQADGSYSHAEGEYTIASGDYSHAEGSTGTTASGNYSHAEGDASLASGSYSHAEGRSTESRGNYSHAEGYDTWTTTAAIYAHVEGYLTTASAFYAHAEGEGSMAKGQASHAEGYYSEAEGAWSHAEGQSTNAIGSYSHAEGNNTQATANHTHAEGNSTEATAQYAHAEGVGSVASGFGSHAEGRLTEARGPYSHAEGYETWATAAAQYAHVEGYYTTASNTYSHAEGYRSKASGIASHAEGRQTDSAGNYSHAGGYKTLSSGDYSCTVGLLTTGSGDYSFAAGNGTIAAGDYQTVIGKFNTSDSSTNTLFIVGNGTSDAARDTALKVTTTQALFYQSIFFSAVGTNSIDMGQGTADASTVLSTNPIYWRKVDIANPLISYHWAAGIDSSENLHFYYGTNPASLTAKGYLENGATGTDIEMNFTGQHRSVAAGSIADYANKVGLIVKSTGVYNPLSGSAISINDAVPVVDLTTTRNDKKCFGVISDAEDVESPTRTHSAGMYVTVYQKKSEDDNRLFVNSLGEGCIWVCNINGNLENGDYITTCEVPGYGMKQDDDLLHNYTVAKITCDCSFDLNSTVYRCEEFVHEGVTYRRAFVGCTYHCG